MKKKIPLISVLAAVLIAGIVAITLAIARANTYAAKLFDTGYVHKINVEISDDDWQDLLKNPTEKTKYKVNVTIDGFEVDEVSFATKGNTSLTQVASSDSDRYSFKINFGKYNKEQTYYGLDKLNLNNIMSDATYMKDYLSYYIMRANGLEAPLVSYVELSINGEVYGLYAAIEDIRDSFLARNGNSEDSILYKPETDQLAGGGFGDINQADRPDQLDQSDQSNVLGNINATRPGSFGNGNNSGADLVYSDDDPENYSAIFDNAITSVTEANKKYLIEALKALSTGENVENYWDVDAVIDYFVSHNYVLNYDSYTGNMLHNYYLLEDNGKFTMLPWDYNLAFGAFSMQGNSSNATTIINWGIDSPLSGTTEDARPLWKLIANNETYLEKYHQKMQKLVNQTSKYVNEVDRVYNLIRSYVESDPTAFYTVDGFDTAVETLKNFLELRSESIKKQLSGDLATSSSEQDSDARVDAADLKISSMGTQGGGKGGDSQKDFQPGANFQLDTNFQPSSDFQPDTDFQPDSNFRPDANFQPGARPDKTSSN